MNTASAALSLFLLLSLTACGSTPVIETRVNYIAPPPQYLVETPIPPPPQGLVVGEAVENYIPTLIDTIRSCNDDKARVAEYAREVASGSKESSKQKGE